MKKIILLACLLILTGCAKQPVIANLNPQLGEQPSGVYSAGTSAVIIGQDSRKSKDVVVYLSDEPATGLANLSAPQDVIAKELVDGLQRQGLTIDRSAPVQVKFDINELLVRVTRANMLYTAEGKTSLTLTVENRGSVDTRIYKREEKKDSATRPDLPKLEKMLNTQLADIIQQMLQDEEVRKLIRRR